MERVIRWNKKALKRFNEQLFWYEVNKGHDFAITFSKNIQSSVLAIVQTPTIGRIEYTIGGKEYRRFVNHPRCKIFYWFSSKEVRIVDIIISNVI